MITVTVESILEDNYIVLLFENGDKIEVSDEYLPNNIKEGQNLSFEIKFNTNIHKSNYDIEGGFKKQIRKSRWMRE